MKQKILSLFIFLVIYPVFASPLFSPTWGFHIDLPDGYEYADGNARDRFSFEGPLNAMFDLVVYNGTYRTMGDLVNDVNRRLGNRGDTDAFAYRDKHAVLIELNFGDFIGWGLSIELAKVNGQTPMLLALAYSPKNGPNLEILHISALDSIAPTEDDELYPGPITEYAFPRGEPKLTPLGKTGISAMIREGDAEAAEYVIEREFFVMATFVQFGDIQTSMIRFYRAIFRDSWDRITDAASKLKQYFSANTATPDKDFAQKALTWVQSFNYERDLQGTDFVNLVTSVTEERGDCDSRAMLWAIILSHADIRAAMMVSVNYSHAMGLADVGGIGAHFEAGGIKWLVAETTAKVNIGLIDQEISDIESWFAVLFY